MQFVYPAQLQRAAPDEIVVFFRDLPECLTSGEDEEEALTEAKDALEEAIAGRIDDGEPIPSPSKRQPGEYEVALSDEMTAMANQYLAYRRNDFSHAAFLEDNKQPAAPDNARPGPCRSRLRSG